MKPSTHLPVGEKLGRLTVLSFSHNVGTTKHRMTLFRCECGSEVVRDEDAVKRGNTKSCGCLRRERSSTKGKNAKHGMSASSEYESYRCAKARCTNPNNASWRYYGGRGIKFLFTSFEQWIGELGLKPTSKHTVDRIDVNGHYEPGNVQWATPKEQEANKR